MLNRSILTRVSALTAVVAVSAGLCLVGAPANADPAIVTTVGNSVEYPLGAGTGGQLALAPGADGSMWYSDGDTTIGHVSATGAISKYALDASQGYPIDLTAGSGGTVWFSTATSIGSVSPGGVVSYYPVPTALVTDSLTLGPDGDIWFAENDEAGDIDTITPAGVITDHPIAAETGSSPAVTDITTGPDGNLWILSVTQNEATGQPVSHVGPLTPGGVYTDHLLGSGELGTAITAGPGGDLLVADVRPATTSSTVSVGLATVTTAGQITQRATGVDAQEPVFEPDVVAASDGTVYESYADSIAVLTTGGGEKSYYVGSGDVSNLRLSPDGSVSYTLGAYTEGPTGHEEFRETSVGLLSASGEESTLYSDSASDFSDSALELNATAWSSTGRLWFVDNTDRAVGSIELLDETRIAGSDRYDTAVQIAETAYPGTAPVVYVATGSDYPDALSAAPAAAKEGGPLLLSRQAEVPAHTLNEIKSLAPKRIVVVGGTDAISDAAFRELQAAVPGSTVSREGGATRFDTSLAVTADAFGSSGASGAFIATGRDYPDALSASSAAGKAGDPVILVSGDSAQTDSNTTGLITSLGATKLYIAGGTAAVSTGIETQLDALVGTEGVDRLAGANRYSTSEAINHAFFTSASNVYLATGADYADALAGAAVAGAQSAPLYLSQPTCLPAADAPDIEALGTSRVTLLGGASALSAGAAQLAQCR